jgi:hypothetical protein
MATQVEAQGEPEGEADGVFFNRPGVATVLWDPTLQAVTTEWHGWADRAEFTAVLESSLIALKTHHGSRALVDSRRQRALPWPDEDWVSEQWYSKALAAGLTRLALVIPESALAMMSIDDVVSRVRGNLEVAYFGTVPDAREWLTAPPTLVRPADSPTQESNIS